jgi:CTP synthase
VAIVEIGGTVGDIEGLPFLEAIRQMRKDVGLNNTVYIHLTLLPYISSTGELKTKPTQHSVRELRGIGIQPDVIICRADYPVDESLKDKISLFCDVEKRAVVPLVTTPVIYEVPLVLEEARLGDFLVERLGLAATKPDLSERDQTAQGAPAHRPGGEVRGVAGRLHQRAGGAVPRRHCPRLAGGHRVDQL